MIINFLEVNGIVKIICLQKKIQLTYDLLVIDVECGKQVKIPYVLSHD